jgi:branched-chain amino acid transport system substrate-binding protein
MSFAQMKQFASFLPKQLYLMNPEWAAAGDSRFQLDSRVQAKQKELYALYREAGIDVDAPAVVAWDPASILVDGLRDLPTNANAGQLRRWIAHLTNYAGVQGVYNFQTRPQRGLDVSDVLVARWDAKNNGWQVVSKPGGAPLAK